MTSARFQYVDRGFKKTLVLLPGWAADYRIFQLLELDYDYLLPVKFLPGPFKIDLLEALEAYGLTRISLLGWSLGAFVAAEFASGHSDMVEELILVSIRKRYDSATLVSIKESLRKNRKAYLYKFYCDCFPSREDMRLFRDRLMKTYTEEMGLEHLLKTLDYLGKSRFEPGMMKGVDKITFIHGTDDRIAPAAEVKELEKEMPQAEFIYIEGEGHIPFFKEEFNRYYGRQTQSQR